MDLNLLMVLDAVLEEGSVQRAATRLHLSQPAVSRSLARIRVATGDQILVRDGHRMVPTAYANQIRTEVHRVALEAHGLLSPPHDFDPRTLRRTFTLRLHAVVTALIVGDLIRNARAAAPGVYLRLLSESYTDPDAVLEAGTDLAVDYENYRLSRIRVELIGETGLALYVRRDHPIAGSPITAEVLRELQFIVHSRADRLHHLIVDAFESFGVDRTIVASVPDGLSILGLVAQSDYAKVGPIDVYRPHGAPLNLVEYQLPFDIPPMQIMMRWHERFDPDPAHAWLRDLVMRTWREFAARSLASSSITPTVDVVESVAV